MSYIQVSQSRKRQFDKDSHTRIKIEKTVNLIKITYTYPNVRPVNLIKITYTRQFLVIFIKFTEVGTYISLTRKISVHHKSVLKIQDFTNFGKKLMFPEVYFIVLESSTDEKNLEFTKFDNLTVFKIVVTIFRPAGSLRQQPT